MQLRILRCYCLLDWLHFSYYGYVFVFVPLSFLVNPIIIVIYPRFESGPPLSRKQRHICSKYSQNRLILYWVSLEQDLAVVFFSAPPIARCVGHVKDLDWPINL